MRKLIKPVFNKDTDTLIKEWDEIVNLRLKQISSHTDLSFDHVVLPTIVGLLSHCFVDKIIDIGCGCGCLTSLLKKHANTVHGVDFSKKSISLCREKFNTLHEVSFFDYNIEQAAPEEMNEFYDLAIGNMLLMTIKDLVYASKFIHAVLKEKSTFVASITHPAFWPRYWGYENESWFNYWDEIPIEAPFNITKQKSNFITTHYHRPIEMYLQVFSDSGFNLKQIVEPKSFVEQSFTVNASSPKFLFFVWEKRHV